MSSSSNFQDTALMSNDEYFNFLEIPPEKIKSATNNFADENLIAQGTTFKVYKGQLLLHSDSQLINIVVRKSLQIHIAMNELMMCKYLNHKNISSTFKIGYYDENTFIINKHETNGSLDKHLGGTNLTWMQRLKICLVVAHALSYIHHYDDAGDGDYVIHGNIQSSKILLDDVWEPKLHGFGHAKIVKKNHGYLTSKYNGTLQYMDPTYEKTKTLTYESDVFSFGVVLFEVLFGRKAFKTNEDNWYFTRLARLHYEERTLDDMIDPDLRKQMDLQSLKIFSEVAYCCLKEQRGERPTMVQIVKRLETSLELQQKHTQTEIMSSSNFQDTALMSDDEYYAFLKIPYKDIKSATNNFSDANLIAEGSCYKVYKGQLLHSSGHKNIVARKSMQLLVAVKEVVICRYLNHKNISSTFKIAEGDKHVILINKHEANGSLDNYLGGTTLKWMQRLRICLGVARALSYIHNHALDDEYIIHGNIKSSKILLDDNWEPKLHGFGFAPKVKRSHRYITRKYNGTLQYMDPTYDKTKTLTYKSDVFSFGVVLFEVLFGRNASIPVRNEDHGYFARLARLHYEERTLDNMIDLDLRKEMDLQSLKIFSETAYCCLKEQRGERPYMDQVVKRLETALELHQKYQTSEHSRAAIGGNHLKGKNLDHLKIRLSDIELATNKFSTSNFIGQGGYGVVYKAELDHFDSTNSPATEGKNKVEYSKRRSTVAIKRLFSRQDGQVEEGFLAEIEMLTNCKHPNIVSLLGFCEEGLERILVYEHASNGSLNDYLGNVKNITNLTWAQRIQISLGIAHGMNYLHYTTEEKQMIIHRDIKSDNILLDDNWVPKIADFGLSKLRPADLKASTINTVNIAGTTVYLDPEYMKTGKLKKESDIYSFGVVLFEIMCGSVAYDEIYYANNDNGLPSTIRRCFNEGTWKELVDPKLKEADENIFMLNGGLNQDSLDTFFTIAFQCLANTQVERPTMKVVIEQLEKALHFQKNSKDNLQISPIDIKQATDNFGEGKYLGEGRYWKQYEGEIPQANGNLCTTVVAKRFDSKSDQGNLLFLRELKVLLEYKHENIVSLVGYCNELDEKIIVYEHAINGSLDKHLDNSSLTWMKRVKICIDVARGLVFFRTKSMIHGDIKSGSIVIDGDWKAKISNLELTENYGEIGEIEHVTGSLSYVDPMFKMQGYLTEWSDIYSLGVVLLEMLSGRLVCGCEESVGDLVQKCNRSKKAFDELVFKDIKEHSDPQSLTTFFKIASQCLELDDYNRPDAHEVVIQLMRALELQEDYEIWEPKLPTDYKDIILMSNTPDIYLNVSKKDLYEMLTTKGILLQQGNLLFVLGGSGERNEMISATNFSYKNRSMRRWQLIPESRFPKVAEMLDITNLKIQIKIKTQLLSPGINYAVHLVFKFHKPRKYTAKWIYVNLKYKMWSNNLHAYFARRREDGWMTIELFRFLNHKKNTNFEVLLESFSRCYCGRRFNCVYVEGIEFRAIDKIKYQEIEKLEDVEQVLKSSSNFDVVRAVRAAGLKMFRNFVCLVRKIKKLPSFPFYFSPRFFLLGLKNLLLNLYRTYGSLKRKCLPRGFAPDGAQPSLIDSQEILQKFGNDERLFLINQVNGKQHLMLSAIGVLYDCSKVKPFHLKLVPDSRFQVVIELLRQQVFGINYKIINQMLLADTDYVCYIVFKLSEKCRGLHCPVRVLNVLQWKNKEIGLLCFRPPSPWNLSHDTIWVPKEREDGWMEVIVWKFNSSSEVRNDHIPMHLKLITYEGTMSGLIVSGLEIRSI